MIEVFAGEGFQNAVKELKLDALQTYSSELYEVWVMTQDSYDLLLAIRDDKWKDSWGWWRTADFTWVSETRRFVINGRIVMGFKVAGYQKWKYSTLLEYLQCEVGATTETSVCAVTTGMAKMNHMSLSQLWGSLQG